MPEPGGAGARRGAAARLRVEKAALERHVRELEVERAAAEREREEAAQDRDALVEQNARLVQVVGELKGLLSQYKSHAKKYKSEYSSLKRQLEEATTSPARGAGISEPCFRIPRWESPGTPVGPASRVRRDSGDVISSSGRRSLAATQTPPTRGSLPRTAPASCGGSGREADGEGGFIGREPDPVDFLQTQMKKRRLDAGQGETCCAGAEALTARDDMAPGQGGVARGAIVHVEVVRGKDTRAALPGHDCPDCAGFWDAVGLPPPRGECSHKRGENQHQQPRADLVQAASRHRARWQRPRTPPGFWDINLTPEQAPPPDGNASMER